jgi:Cu/Ag efflux protein CusF
MNRWLTLSSGFVVVALLSAGLAFGQQPRPPECDKSRVPDKIEGQVVRVDPATNKVTIRDDRGMTHEFQATKETAQDMKPGDRVEARLRQAPAKC